MVSETPSGPAGSRADVVIERAGDVVTIRLDRPDVLNAFRARTRSELHDALTALRDDSAVRVVVVTGTGRAFSAGQDLQELEAQLAASREAGTAAAEQRGLEELQALTRALLALPQVTIAALNGVAVGLGAELALACDIRLAARSASIGFPEARRAMFQTNGVMWLLQRIGLVNAVHDDTELAAAAAALGRRVAANAPASLALAKSLLRETWGLELEAVMARESAGMLACLGSRDLREGNQAFLEKRSPVYDGS